MEEEFKNMLEELGLELDEPTLKILNILEKKPEVSETDIAEKLDIKINSARKLLYRLSELNVANYIKRRHAEKKWWYVYFWQLDKRKIYEAYLKKKRQEFSLRQKQLEEERKYTFICKKCGDKYSYQSGLENDFTCPSCESALAEITTSRDIKALEREIQTLEGEIKHLVTLTEKEKVIMDGEAKEAKEEPVKKEAAKKPVKKVTKKPVKKPVKKVVKKKPTKKKPVRKVAKKPAKKPVKKKPIKKPAKKPVKKKPTKKPVRKPAKKPAKKEKSNKEEKKKKEEKKRSLKKALVRVLRRKK